MDVSGEVAAILDGHILVTSPMENERRDVNRGKDVSDIDLTVHHGQGENRAGGPRTPPLGPVNQFRLVRFIIPIAPYILDHLRWPER